MSHAVATWLVDAFQRHSGGHTVEEMTALVLAPHIGSEETFILLEGDRPVGTASLTCGDLAAHPDLTLWLAWGLPYATRWNQTPNRMPSIEVSVESGSA